MGAAAVIASLEPVTRSIFSEVEKLVSLILCLPISAALSGTLVLFPPTYENMDAEHYDPATSDSTGHSVESQRSLTEC